MNGLEQVSNLWRQVEEAMSHHRKEKAGDITGMDALNRFWKTKVAEDGDIDAPPHIGETTCAIRTETWNTKKLSEKIGYIRHKGAAPKQDDGALIGIDWKEKIFLIDGANRLNRWVENNDTAVHEIILISVNE